MPLFRRPFMRAKPAILVTAILFLLSACGSSPESLIVGRWEVQNAPTKMTAQFNKDGTASMTMLGQTVRGTYKLNGDGELEWSMNGLTSKGKVKVTETDLELTDSSNRTIRYKRQ
jgi:starvation-inducible outer membrane lipoprotein